MHLKIEPEKRVRFGRRNDNDADADVDVDVEGDIIV
jgi:hypothetical protein